MDATLAAAAIGVGGTVIVGLAGFWASVRNTDKTIELARSTVDLTRRSVELTEQGQVTERYSKAIEQLGSDKLDVRIGGIYALERIAHDSPRDHPTIIEVLAAFIREHSHEQWPPAEDGADLPARKTRPDVQAAATVIGRRVIQHDSQPINLEAANLTGADLNSADLHDANLAGAHLVGVNLTRAYLTSVNLTDAYIPAANLTDAQLFLANLTGADLSNTDLTGADLTFARLIDTKLVEARLTSAKLSHAPPLTGADLTGAYWPKSGVVPEGWQRDTDSGRLERSHPNSGDAAAE